MSSLMNFGKTLLTRFCQQGLADRANFLKNIAVAGWILSSAAQTVAVVFNNKIPSKEKKFLIPQEIFDGIVNCTLFWFIASKSTNLGKKLVLNKHILPAKIAPLMKDFTCKFKNLDKLKAAFLSHVNAVGTPSDVRIADNAIEGMGVLTGIIGSIISNNICTPIIRNKLAAYYQKRELANSTSQVPLNPNFGKIDYSKYNFDKLASAPKVSTFKGFYTKTDMRV